MKLNYDCLRALLLVLEKELVMEDDLIYPQVSLNEILEKMPDFSKADIVYTSVIAEEAGLIEANIISADNGIIGCIYLGLSYEGHQFLDTVRDNKVWKKTKNTISKVGGASFEIIKSVAAFALESLLHI